jgi:hypothetical protein
MNKTMDCEEARISLGVYVLGAIDPAERAMVEGHLATCQACRDELAGLAGLPALLARVSTDEALQLGEDLPGLGLVADDPLAEDESALTPPGSLLAALGQPLAADAPPPVPAARPPAEPPGNVVDLGSARRRRAWRNGLLTAAAAIIIAVGSFTGGHLLTGGSGVSNSASGDNSNFGPVGAWETTKLVQDSAGQGAQIRYRTTGWGLQIDTRVIGIPIGTTCDLYVITKSGQRVQAANWRTDGNEGAVWYSGSTAFTDDEVASFQITTGGRTPPVTIDASDS